MKFAPTLVLALLLGALVAGCSSSGDSGDQASTSTGQKSADFTPVIAKVGDVEITQGYFDERYRQLPPASQAKFSGEDWRSRFLDELIEETLLYEQAEAEKYEQSPEVEAALEAAKRRILVNAFTKHVEDTAMPTEEEIQEHWELRKEDYKELDRVLVSHIRCADKAKIDEAYAKLEAGESFEKVAWEYDEDPNSRANKGLIGWVNPGGFVLGVGYDERFTNIAFELGHLQYSEPVELNGNWHIIRAGNKVIGDMPSFEEARPRVIEDIRPRAVRREYERLVEELRQRYQVSRFGEFQEGPPQTESQLYKLASEARNPYARVAYYEKLVEQYPKSEYADDSLFLLGFIWSEELVDAPNAAGYLQRLMDEYPDSPYVEDARWLMHNLAGRVRGLKDAGASDAGQLQRNLDDYRSN